MQFHSLPSVTGLQWKVLRVNQSLYCINSLHAYTDVHTKSYTVETWRVLFTTKLKHAF